MQIISDDAKCKPKQGWCKPVQRYEQNNVNHFSLTFPKVSFFFRESQSQWKYYKKSFIEGFFIKKSHLLKDFCIFAENFNKMVEQTLYQLMEDLIRLVPNEFHRYNYNDINWESQGLDS